MKFFQTVNNITKGIIEAADNHREKLQKIRAKLESKDDVELMYIESSGSYLEQKVARQILHERGI